MTTSAPNTQPLAGKKVVVTRTRALAGKLAEELEAEGAKIIEFPTIEIRPPEKSLDVDRLGEYDWVVFTSVNAVEYFSHGLDAIGRSIREIESASICAVGPATKEALEALGPKVDLVPVEFKAESIVDALHHSGIADAAFPDLRFLLPRGDLARDCLPQALRGLGATVTELIAYRNVKPDVAESDIEALVGSQPDWVTFTSASTAKNFSEILGPRNLSRLGRAARYASIGPTTTQAARDGGIDVAVEPGQHDIPGLVEAMVDWQRSRIGR